MKKLLAVLMAVCMVLSMSACGGGDKKETKAVSGETKTEAGSTKEASDGETYKVAFISRNMADSFAARIAKSMEEEWEANYKDLFTLDILDAESDSAKENTLIETCITKEYDCIIIQPNDGDLQLPYAQKVVDAGIKCITTNAGIREVEGGSWIDADPYDQGRVLAELAVEKAPENARVVILSCNPGNLHTESRLKAYKDIFVKQRPDCEILAEKITDRADEGTFMATMEDWVQSYGKIDVVLTIGDALAMSCYEVVKDNPDYKDIQTYGVDAVPEALLAIKKGTYTATVMQNTKELAEKNLAAAARLLKGEDEVIEESIDTILITKDNVDEYIDFYIEQGALTQEEVDEAMKN
ncbi:sugar ABC transporter substrate-binding protein [Qiania dongpingensis]|uniref:Sugar ABC transporter substrate-binding protein n=1 Tax=Qiania dongpingensis TaxID=2763669 RepID=A0A7G9G1E8_9FIRM|nr:sugar ABC transporter substrate-binding protein [Qiania dongpingensis]QNM04630.1 sugar ABC transporter substrate-binding protein [Qiania dongpingensis]